MISYRMSGVNGLQLGKISPEKVVEYNSQLQSRKLEGERQTSFEKYGIEDWEVVELTGPEILNLQSFVETSGVVSPAYWLWKLCGENISVGSVVKYVREHRDELPKEVLPWIGHLINEDILKDMQEKIENGNIAPPLLIIPVILGKESDWGMLNLGNIFDGNMRLMHIANWLLDQDENAINNFKLKVMVGHIDIIKYLLFNGYYFYENIRNHVHGKYNNDLMSFEELLKLAKQRLGYQK